MVRAALGSWNREHGTHRAVAVLGYWNDTLGAARSVSAVSSSAASLEAEHAGHLDGREDLAPDVVVGGGVVERLPGEADLVLGRGQLLLEGEHVLVGLEVRVRLGEGKEPA